MLETKFDTRTKQLAELIIVLYILTFKFLDSRGEDRRLNRMVASIPQI
jgi:hypothetical protein